MAHVPRLFVPGRLAAGPLTLDGDQAKRLGAVMRMRAGDTFRVFSGDGREWAATVTAVEKARLHANVGELARQEAAQPIVLETWCALVRPNRFDWAIEKCTEAGADIIRPLLSEHAARGEGSSQQRQERWDRIAIVAAEQSGRLRVPVVEAPESFEQLLERHRGALLLGDRGGRSWQEAAALLPERGLVAVAIGPEGGFSDEEVARAKARGAITVSLGPNVLRAETAAVVATALVRSLGR
jgi:16S rRNA (uracil1498-N3)-methyltransferase